MSAHAPKFLVENLSCPREVMQFRLVYRGPLPASGNSSKKPDDVRRIRDQFHPQLELLWRTHRALKRLRYTARVPDGSGSAMGMAVDESPLDVEFDPSHPVKSGYVDLTEPIAQDGKTYVPLVRKSLDLTCSLGILFLRQEEPGALVLQGGDLDGRIKTLFDALRMPTADVVARYPQAQDPTYCLLENDSLISAFDVDSDRLLLPETDHAHEVLLVIDVSVNVMRLGTWNYCLLGN
jgi:hypothetical protein